MIRMTNDSLTQAATDTVSVFEQTKGIPMLDRAIEVLAWIWHIFVESDSALRTLAIVILTTITVIVVYRMSRRVLRRYMTARAMKTENIENFLLFWRYFWMVSAVILIAVSFSGSIANVGISAAFLGMVLGWSLQAPVTGIAAWLMIILKRPFKIGDRVIINGITGDVTDINLTHVLLNQVGGTVGGEDKSGRGVLIPNATLFSQVIYNYIMETGYLLDEVTVQVTFESDIEETERICLNAAREVTHEIIAETGTEPYTRMEFTDWGIRIRVRYQALAMERQRMTSEVTRSIHRQFTGNPKVEFRYPLQEIRYRPQEHLSEYVRQQNEYVEKHTEDFGDRG
jgi:small-conductance mechanosensitive channel